MDELEREMMLYRNAHDAAAGYFRLRYYSLITVCMLLSFGTTTLSGWMDATGVFKGTSARRCT